ncbi:MAG: ABC transporter substrate-binding protein [Xanthobacteraceae bacterium]
MKRASVPLLRRDFITVLGGAAAWRTSAWAQQPEHIRRIGVLMDYSQADQFAESLLKAFRERLESFGWSDGRNIYITYRWAAGDADRLRSYSAELAGLKPDVIFGRGTPVIAALRAATGSIPIVFVNANNPIGSGFIASMARPGGNITGFVAFEPDMGGKWLQTLKEIEPKITRVGLLYNPQSHTGQHFPSIELASPSLAMKIVRLPFYNAGGIERALGDYAVGSNAGILVMPDNSTNLHRDLIVRLATQYRLPAIYPFRQFMVAGGLACYGADEKDQSEKAAEYVNRILNGARPGDLPVQFPTRFELVLNNKAAKAIGLAIPPTMLARADEVID